jgi:isopentenyl-diphosphate delta-isomerase
MQSGETKVEYFQTYNDAGESLGLVPRNQVHAQGLWHCSAHVLLFNMAGELLLQRRAEDKDLYPGCWDYSVGEHLMPGETFRQGVERGLHEELGLQINVIVSLGEIKKETWSGAGFIDRSIFQGFVARVSGSIVISRSEVAQVKWVSPSELTRLIETEAELFTPWSLPHLVNGQVALDRLLDFESTAE